MTKSEINIVKREHSNPFEVMSYSLLFYCHSGLPFPIVITIFALYRFLFDLNGPITKRMVMGNWEFINLVALDILCIYYQYFRLLRFICVIICLLTEYEVHGTTIFNASFTKMLDRWTATKRKCLTIRDKQRSD